MAGYIDDCTLLRDEPKTQAKNKNRTGWTPIEYVSSADTLALMHKADALIESLNNEIVAFVQSGKGREVFLKNWNIFREEWRKFYLEHGSWWSRSGVKPYESAEEFIERINKWREAFAAEGGAYTGPGPREGDRPKSGFPWWILIGAAVVGTGAYVYIKGRSGLEARRNIAWHKAAMEAVDAEKAAARRKQELQAMRQAEFVKRYGKSPLGA
ncbi:MAG: hypothetical protein V1784_07145 [bacterium]